MTIKIEFPSDRKDIAAALGRALIEIGGESVTLSTTSDVSSHEQLAADGAALIDNGPYYWVNRETYSYGIADTDADIPDDFQAELVTKDVYDHLVSEWDPEPTPLSDDVPPPADDVPPPSGESVELDARGFPWDSRIHSKNKSKNADDTWRYCRKPSNFETKEQWNIYIEQIEEELKGNDVPPPAEESTDDVPPPSGESSEPNANSVFGNDVPPPAEEPTDDIPPPSDEYEEKTFGELMTLTTSNQKNNSVEKINEVLTEMGIVNPNGNSALPVLKSDHPERISEVYSKLEGKL